MAYPLIVLEGVDYSGKTTIINKLKQEIDQDIYFGHEPGGTEFSENIRNLLFNYGQELNPEEKLQLFEMSRRNFIQSVVKNKLLEMPVILDRFVGSTVAYQVFGDRLNLDNVVQYNDKALNNLEIDMTLLLEIDLKTFEERRNLSDENNDLDNYDNHFYQDIIDNYSFALNTTPSKEIYVINAKEQEDKVYQSVKMALKMKGIKFKG